MADYGLTPTGFVPKTFEILLAQIFGSLQSNFGSSINLSNGILYRVTAIFTACIAELWELGETVNSGQDPDASTGTNLAAIAALTGTLPLEAEPSLVTLTLTGDPATLVASGNRAKTASTGKAFETTADATLAAASAWTLAHTYAVGDRVASTGRVYICTLGGMAGGPAPATADDTEITTDVPHWRFIGEGTASADAPAQCTETGPITAVSGDITVRDTAVGGWSGVKNLLDATLGRDVETDAELRVRREQELSQAGSTVPDAIRADLLEVRDSTGTKFVQNVTVFYNDTDVTDGDGVPPHSVECLVRMPVSGTYDQLIYDRLLQSVAAGIHTHGTSVGSSNDSEGTAHTIKFTRPAEITIYVDLTYTKDPKTYPADGDAQVKQAIVDYGDAQDSGVDAVATRIGAQAFKVAGVLDVPRSGSLGGCLIKTSAGPTSDVTIAISTRQLAVYDTSRITVHTSNATP